MVRRRYYYDKRTCNYERVKTSRWAVLFGLVGFLAASCVMATGILAWYSACFDLPQEARLKRENELLQHHYKQICQEIDKSNQVLAHLQDQDDELYRLILEAEPIPRAARRVERDKADFLHQSLANQHDLIATTLRKIECLRRQLAVQSESYDELQKLARENEKRLAAIPAIQPLSNKHLKRLSSPFGMRIHPIHKIPIMHEGVDFAAPRGTPIYATGSGVVKRTKRNFGGYGNYVEIDHGYGFLTRYCHMQSFVVKPGQSVTRGQFIGRVGSSGTATGAHLHYEVIKNKRNVNPAHYFVSDLDAQQYDMLLELASRKIQVPS